MLRIGRAGSVAEITVTNRVEGGVINIVERLLVSIQLAACHLFGGLQPCLDLAVGLFLLRFVGIPEHPQRLGPLGHYRYSAAAGKHLQHFHATRHICQFSTEVERVLLNAVVSGAAGPDRLRHFFGNTWPMFQWVLVQHVEHAVGARGVIARHVCQRRRHHLDNRESWQRCGGRRALQAIADTLQGRLNFIRTGCCKSVRFTDLTGEVLLADVLERGFIDSFLDLALCRCGDLF
ncbi:hypothetical protein ALP75_202798 [Pseudomonas syringae pv. actinidiae]|nr:hypothetical protein ALP75_202798 [Pseudomonas syringae pv. actinidiae]